MNIKVKAPKNTDHPKDSSMTKEMAMTFFATTLSIILTFGTAHYVERNQERKDGRQTAMMIIHDIDDYAEGFREAAKEEDETFQKTIYVINHLDEIETISEDTLELVLNYLIHSEGPRMSFDDSKERTFISNQNNWKNIDNPKFIDLVEQFFHKRRVAIEDMNTSIAWREPLPAEFYYELLKKSYSTNSDFDYAAILREQLRDPQVVFYIQLSTLRQKQLNNIAQEWQHTSDQCKFIMGITDQELEKYIQKQERTGRPLKDRDLLGSWLNIGGNDYHESIEFLKDKTFRHTLERYYPSRLFAGKLIFRQVLSGRWELQGDSLYRYYESHRDYTLDKSQISYSEELRDSVEAYLEHTEANVARRMEAISKEPGRTSVRFVSIDASGTKVEMKEQEGEEEVPSAYMVREKKD